MHKKKFVLVLLLGVIIGVGLWWFTRSKEVDSENVAVMTPTKVAAPKAVQVVQTNQVELPKAPAVPAKAEVAEANSASDSADPRNDLKTALPDLARLTRAGDDLAIYQTYATWGKLDPQRMEQIRAGQLRAQANPNPYDSLRNLASAQFLESLQNLTPIYNDAGDEARYQSTMQVPRPPDGVVADAVLTTEYFIKKNGKWYWRGEVQTH